MDTTWRALPVAHSSKVPPLLVSIDIQATSYTIRLTDLAHIWIEEMERKAICMRGWSENTVVDPSDTPENMVQFLSHLRSALDTSQPGHDQTSVDLSPASSSDTEGGGLTLRITCQLPGLQPLKWPMHLKMASSSSSVATGLVLPLIEAQHSCMQQLDSLTNKLAQKDALLAKLLDKLEERGVGLDTVFTSLSTKRKVTRAMAEEKIKGLSPFDKHQWEKEAKTSQEDTDAYTLIQGVFGDKGLPCSMPAYPGDSPQLDQWWKSFQLAASVPIHSGVKSDDQKAKPIPSSAPSAADDVETASEGDDDDDDDGGFEVQETPPHIKAKKQQQAARSSPSPKGSSTDSGDAASPSVQHDVLESPAVEISSHQPSNSSRIGIVGGKNATEKITSTFEHDENRKDAQAQNSDSATASDLDEDVTASVTESSPPPPMPKDSPPRKGRLGRIGGKGTVGPASSTEEEAKAPATAATAAPRQKIGLIGKKQSVEPESSASPQARGRSSEAEGTASSKRETSQERAARRREELKRDLEKKAAAGPTKKKRKF